jgi:hypothetical protein
MNSLFDRTPYRDETLYGLHDPRTARPGYCTAFYRLYRYLEFAGHMSGTAQPSVFRVVHDERPPSGGERSSFASSTLDRPHTLDPTWPSCIIAPPPGKGRGGVPFRRNSAEIAAHCAILPRLGRQRHLISWCHSRRLGADVLEQFRCCPRMLLRTVTALGRASNVRRSREPDNNQRCGNSHYCNAVNELIKPL